jgi:hypothetical protein
MNPLSTFRGHKETGLAKEISKRNHTFKEALITMGSARLKHSPNNNDLSVMSC